MSCLTEGYFDFTLRQDYQDGRLYVDKTKYHTDELVETGDWFQDHCIQIEGFYQRKRIRCSKLKFWKFIMAIICRSLLKVAWN